MQSQTDKAAYTPTETVKIIGNIDNSNCTRDIKKVKVQLVEKVRLNARRKVRNMLSPFESPEEKLMGFLTSEDTEYNNSFVILEKDYPGIPKGESTKGENQYMELPLSEYGQDLNDKDSKEESKDDHKEEIKDRDDKDDKYLAEGVQPTSIGKLVNITYELKIVPDYNMCCGCCSRVETTISLFISPPKLQSYQVLHAPPNWDPQVFKSKNFHEPIQKIEDQVEES